MTAGVLLLALTLVAAPTWAAPEKGKRCSDGIDNDGDGLVDDADPDCGGDGGGDDPGGTILRILTTPGATVFNDGSNAYTDQQLTGGDTCVHSFIGGRGFSFTHFDWEVGHDPLRGCNQRHPADARFYVLELADADACAEVGAPFSGGACTFAPSPDTQGPRVRIEDLFNDKKNAAVEVRFLWEQGAAAIEHRLVPLASQNDLVTVDGGKRSVAADGEMYVLQVAGGNGPGGGWQSVGGAFPMTFLIEIEDP